MAMNKGMVAAAVAVAVAAGGWFAYHQHSTVAMRSLAYVPADTLLFAGGTQPLPWSTLMAFRNQFNSGIDSQDLKQLLDSLADEDPQSPEATPDGVRLLVSLYAQYVQLLQDPKLTPQKLGVPEQIDSAFYTVGALPVLRIALGDEKVFDNLLQQAEARVKVKPETVKLKDQSYLRYPLLADAEEPVYLALAKRDGFLIVTLDTSNLIPPAEGLEPAFGMTKPATALASTDTLPNLIKEQGLAPFSLGYLNHEGLVRTLTRADSPLGKLADRLSHGDISKELAAYRTPQCQQDIEGIAKVWPRTVFGYTKVETDSSPMQMSSLLKLVSSDLDTLGELQKIRGFLPDFAANPSLLSWQVGMNLDALTPALGKLWGKAVQAPFQCEPLRQLQADLKNANPAMLGAMTGMVQGVQGVGLELLSLKLAPHEGPGLPDFSDLSFLINLSSSQPQVVWHSLQALQPSLASVNLPADGQSVELPEALPVSLPSPLRLGLNGQHITLFSGEAGQKLASELGKQSLKANGLFRFAIDYGLIGEVMNYTLRDEERLLQISRQRADAEVAAAASGAAGTDVQGAKDMQEQVQHQVDELKRVQQMMTQLHGVRLDTKLDIDNHGIGLQADMQVPKKQ